jgi:hypothetical protein
VPVFALGVDLLDDATPAQRLQSLREEIFRDSRNAAVKVAEAQLSDEQLAKNERRPALGEDLGAEGNGTELSIGGHDLKVWSPKPRGKLVL